MRSAQQSGVGLTAAPRDSDHWNAETWPGFGPGKPRGPGDSIDVTIRGRTLLDIEKDVAVRLLDAHGGDRCQAAASLQIEQERLADLLVPPPGGAVLPWDLPPLEEVHAALMEDGCQPATEVASDGAGGGSSGEDVGSAGSCAAWVVLVPASQGCPEAREVSCA